MTIPGRASFWESARLALITVVAARVILAAWAVAVPQFRSPVEPASTSGSPYLDAPRIDEGVAGLLLGRPGHEGLLPSNWVESAVGGNGFGATLFASLAGAVMYFATLTEVPILQGLIGAGMGPGPSLALLLAGPALSLPNMIVIASVIGWKKTGVYIGLVVVMATVTGLIYGTLVA